MKTPVYSCLMTFILPDWKRNQFVDVRIGRRRKTIGIQFGAGFFVNLGYLILCFETFWCENVLITSNVFEIKDPARVRVPIEFKILAALRILGRGNCVQDIEKFSGIAESTCLALFNVALLSFM